MKKLIPLLCLSLLITSCGNERRELGITFAFDAAITSATKYPSYFKDITIPFSAACEVDFLLKPINIQRLDISNKEVETNAWFFKDMEDNTIEFSKFWLEHYFRDSLINNYLTQASVEEVSIDNWISNNRDILYIYSEESDLTEFKGKPVFNNAQELYTKIQESSCGNSSGKVVVLINPSGLMGRVDKLEQINQLLSELAPGERGEKADEIINIQSEPIEHSEDPFEIYQYVLITVVSDDHHHDSFKLLARAVKLAIEQGKARILYNRIVRDDHHEEGMARADKRIWKLKTHPEHWDPLMEALEHNNTDLIEHEVAEGNH